MPAYLFNCDDDHLQNKQEKFDYDDKLAVFDLLNSMMIA